MAVRIRDNVEILEIEENNSVCPVLIWDDEHVVLVDAGFPGQYDKIAAEIGRVGFSVNRLDMLIFTHQDLDHIGCAQEILAASPGIVTVAHEKEAPYIEGVEPSLKASAKLRAGGLSDEERERAEQSVKRAKEHAVPILKKSVDGETLPIAGGIELIHTPGHTTGHQCVYLRGAKLLIAGDALNRGGEGLKGPNPIHTLDMPQATESLKKLIRLDIESIVCYHGGLFEADAKAALRAIVGA